MTDIDKRVSCANLPPSLDPPILSSSGIKGPEKQGRMKTFKQSLLYQDKPMKLTGGMHRSLWGEQECSLLQDRKEWKNAQVTSQQAHLSLLHGEALLEIHPKCLLLFLFSHLSTEVTEGPGLCP